MKISMAKGIFREKQPKENAIFSKKTLFEYSLCFEKFSMNDLRWTPGQCVISKSHKMPELSDDSTSSKRKIHKNEGESFSVVATDLNFKIKLYIKNWRENSIKKVRKLTFSWSKIIHFGCPQERQSQISFIRKAKIFQR